MNLVSGDDILSGVKRTLGLHEASHNAVRHEQLIALRHHPGDDGVIRPLSTFHVIGVALDQSEPSSAVLQGEATSFRDRSCSEPSTPTQ